MMKKVLCAALVGSLMCAVGASAQTTVTLELQSDTEDEYYVEATITGGDASEGLALIGFDVNFTAGGPPTQMSAPGAMSSFVVNDGLNNPDGYGGTISGNILLQVGGAQNTIGNPGPTPPYPVGAVVTGVGATTITVATGTCDNTTDTMSLENCFANVIIGGETGPVVYAVSAADVTCLGTGVECFAGGAAAATVLTAGSWKTHTVVGSDVIPINVAGQVQNQDVTSESRFLPGDTSKGGITELRITFNVAPGLPDGNMANANGVLVSEQTCVTCPCTGSQAAYAAYSGLATMTPSVVGSDLVLTFSPELEEDTTYRFEFGSVVTSIVGQQVEVRALPGDLDGNGQTVGFDQLTLNGVWSGAGYSPESDLDLNGQTVGFDQLLLNGVWASATNCAP